MVPNAAHADTKRAPIHEASSWLARRMAVVEDDQDHQSQVVGQLRMRDVVVDEVAEVEDHSVRDAVEHVRGVADDS